MNAAALLLICLLTALLSALLACKHNPLRILDVPNARSLHARPTPRTGGLAVLMGMATGWMLLARQGMWMDAMSAIVVALLVIAAVSFADDVKELSPLLRLLSHLAAAGILLTSGFALPWNGIGALISLLVIVWMVNLYNFMDGIDGFAAGMSASGFAFLGLAGWFGGNVVYAWFCWTVAAACGFLLFNILPARIFMGDVGSTSLGLLATACALWGIRLKLFAWRYPVLVFTPFIVDATVTLVRRIIHGEKVWQAHKTHFFPTLGAARLGPPQDGAGGVCMDGRQRLRRPGGMPLAGREGPSRYRRGPPSRERARPLRGSAGTSGGRDRAVHRLERGAGGGEGAAAAGREGARPIPARRTPAQGPDGGRCPAAGVPFLVASIYVR